MTVKNESIKIKLISKDNMPRKCGSGYILKSAVKISIKPGEMALVSSGTSMAIPSSLYGQLNILDEYIGKINLLGGVIDSDYRGDIKAIIFNESNEDFCINENEDLCKIIFIKINNDDLIEVDDLNESERGVSGFGSTGK